MDRQVLVEMKVPRRASVKRVRELASALTEHGFEWDPDYLVPSELPEGVKEPKGPQRYRHVLVRGRLPEGREPDLENQPNVVRVWSDAPIAPLAVEGDEDDEEATVKPKSPFTF